MDNSQAKDAAPKPPEKAAHIQTMASNRRAMNKLDWAKGQVVNERRDATGKIVGTATY